MSDHGTEQSKEPGDVEYGELPELTRALRAFGSSRQAGGTMQSQFFRPLLESRRRAADARTPAARLRAFDVAELERALDRALDRIVSEWPDTREPARRAVRAEMTERVTPYAAALARLSHLSQQAQTAKPGGELAAWRAWTVQLAATFDAADRSWMALSSLVRALSDRKIS